MKVHFGGRLFLAAAVLGAVALMTVGFFAVLGVRSGVAGPASAPAAAPPNPGHSYDQVELPAGTWPGLDADLLDGLDSTAFSTGPHTTSLPWTSITDMPAGFADDIDDDILGGLSCANGEIAKWDGSAWQCAADQAGAGTLSRMGFSTTAVDSGGDVGSHTSVTVGADGLPLISYRANTGADLKVAHCGDPDCSASVNPNTITIVDSVGGLGMYTSVTVGADGLPLISYYGGTNDELKVAHCGDPDCSASVNPNTITTVDSVGGTYTSVTVGADGLPLISYYDETNDDLKVAHCGDPDCHESVNPNTITTVDTAEEPDTTNVGMYTSVTVGADGLPVISYHDWTNGDLKVAHCGDPDCSASVNPNTITTVDSGVAAVGYDSSVTVGVDGLPVISYYDFGFANLKVAHCGDPDCSGSVNPNTITAVDSAGTVGRYTSVTVGADGLPLISYYDGTNGDLKVAHCGNAACSAGNTITTVESAGTVGQYTSLTVGVDGQPVISYYDVTNFDLKVAHCSNRFCVPYHRPR